MENPRIIGHIVAVQGFRVKVELLPETRSALRATLDGVQVAVAINALPQFLDWCRSGCDRNHNRS